MYEDFFELERRPFAFFPDASSVFWTENHERTFAALRDGLARQCPITLVTGEVGAGKTTMIRHLLENLSSDYSVGLISNFTSSRDNVLQWVLSSFDQDFSNASEPELLERFQAFVIGEFAAGRTTVLILDEAQNLSDQDIENFRLLSNINIDGNVLFLLVLVGQPELRQRLLAHEYRQVMQRVGSQFHLTAMSAAETAGYVRHLLQSAGAKSEIFDIGALKSIYSATSGLPRKVNILSDLCMASAFAVDAREIDKDFVLSTLDTLRERGIFNTLTEVTEPTAEVPSEPENAIVAEVIVPSETIAQSKDEVQIAERVEELPAADDPLKSILYTLGKEEPARAAKSIDTSSEPEAGPIIYLGGQNHLVSDNSEDHLAERNDDLETPPKTRKLVIGAALIATSALVALAFVDKTWVMRSDSTPIDFGAPGALKAPSDLRGYSEISVAAETKRYTSLPSKSVNQPLGPAPPDFGISPSDQARSPTRPGFKAFSSSFVALADTLVSDRTDLKLPSTTVNPVSTRFASTSVLSSSIGVSLGTDGFQLHRRPSHNVVNGQKHQAVAQFPIITDIVQFPVSNASFELSQLSPISFSDQAQVRKITAHTRAFGETYQMPLVSHVVPWRHVGPHGLGKTVTAKVPFSEHTLSTAPDNVPSLNVPSFGEPSHRFEPAKRSIRAPSADYLLKLLMTDRTAGPINPSGVKKIPAETINLDDGKSYFRQALETTEGQTTIATLYARAALRGHPRAAYYLGQVYETGDGVAVDLALAKSWYALAVDHNLRAKERVEQIAANDSSENESSLSAPELLLSEPLGDELGEFVWSSGTGADVSDYLIQLAHADDPESFTTHHIKTSAAILPVPKLATHWRAIAIDLKNDRYSASAWQAIGSSDQENSDQVVQLSPFVAPFVTILSSTAEQQDLSTALEKFNISNRVVAMREPHLMDQHVYYFYEQDREAALAIASVVSDRGVDTVLKSSPRAHKIVARPGDLLIAVPSLPLPRDPHVER